MAKLTGGSFKRVSPEDIKVRASTLNQLVDVIQEDISGSATRKKYQVFVTGGVGPGVTSSLFQTVYDQDFSLQTANPIFDMTIGLFSSGTTVTNCSTGQDSAGKLLFPSQSLMMREKVDIYKQYAANLIGDADTAFFAPFGSVSTSTSDRHANDRIEEALFLSFKRLFSRDRIKRETFALRIYRSGNLDGSSNATTFEKNIPGWPPYPNRSNLALTSISGSSILSDIGAASNVRRTFGGDVGNIVNSANTAESLGLIFYDQGTVVLDMGKMFWTDQHMSGAIQAMAVAGTLDGDTIAAGYTVMGTLAGGNKEAKWVPDFLVSGSIDQIVDCIASTRFQSGSLTAATFQNITNINSTLIFCRATADEFNYSTNPTYTDTAGRIRVVDQGQEDTQRSFTFPTTVGLHDEFGNLLAVAKMSRPIEKNDEKDITFRIRLDF
jgi:hypothetical protein